MDGPFWFELEAVPRPVGSGDVRFRFWDGRYRIDGTVEMEGSTTLQVIRDALITASTHTLEVVTERGWVDGHTKKLEQAVCDLQRS